MVFFNLGFWQDLVSNLLATVLGVVVGIPTALWVDRFLIRRQEEKEATKERALATQRRRQMLQILREALQKNLNLVRQMEGELQPATVLFYNVDTQLLEATSAIKYEILDELELSRLLDSIRYELLHLHRKVELQLEIEYSASKAMTSYGKMRAQLVQAIRDHFPRIKDEISQALEMIAVQMQQA